LFRRSQAPKPAHDKVENLAKEYLAELIEVDVTFEKGTAVLEQYRAKYPELASYIREIVPGERRISLGLDFPGRIHGQHSFFGQPREQHPDGGHVLFDSGRLGLALEDFDICGNRDRFNVFEVLIPSALRPGQELLDRPVIAARVLAFRIGTVKNSTNFFRVDGPERSMMVGVAKESGETTASSEFEINHCAGT
jgi:hypothetical protein